MPHLTRRAFATLTGKSALATVALPGLAFAEQISLFNGHDLDGWIHFENSTNISPAEITDPPAFIARIVAAADPVSTYILQQCDEPTRTQLKAYSPSSPDAKATITALVGQLNRLIKGPSLYTPSRFAGVELRFETQQYLIENRDNESFLVWLNRLLLEDAYPQIKKKPMTGWDVKDGTIASTGSGRGVIYTQQDYARYRILFTMRHVSGTPDHQACVLVFCTRPALNEKALDALGGIQFQVPNGGHWDYRPGHNNAGTAFTTINKTQFDPHAWSRVEVLVDATKGTARMAVAQPVGSKAVEVLAFNDPAAGRPGPFALQMHNAGLFDEYKDIVIEPNPADDRFTITG